MLIPVTIDAGRINQRNCLIEERTFAELHLREDHVEEFVRLNIDLVFEDESLLLVGRQVFDANGKRCDLVAVSQDGTLVLIELKRDAQDSKGRSEPFESQAIRYAATLATIADESELVEKLFVPYIERHKHEYSLGDLSASEYAHRQLKTFLAGNQSVETFNKRQRIVLLASGFDDETLSSAVWLSRQGISISCLRLVPLEIDGNQFLQCETLVPLPKAADYLVPFPEPGARRVAPASAVEGSARSSRRSLPRMRKLMEWGIVAAGDVLCLKNYQDSEATLVDANIVEYKGEKMSPNEWGQAVTGWSTIAIYDWAMKGGRTLSDLRSERMAEEERKLAASDAEPEDVQA